MAESLVYCNLYFQGEPLLHPQLEGLIDTCRGHGIYASTSTNAHHLTAKRAQSLVEAGLNRLIVSIDGATQNPMPRTASAASSNAFWKAPGTSWRPRVLRNVEPTSFGNSWW